MYFIFSPYYSGLSNVIMSYELAAAISLITNRIMVRPPSAWLINYSGKTVDEFSNIDSLFDLDILNSNIPNVVLDSVEELNLLKNDMRSNNSHTGNILKCTKDITDITQSRTLSDSHVVLYTEIKDLVDFSNFGKNRTKKCISSDRKYLYYGDGLFGHFWYHVYAKNKTYRNLIKQKINKAFDYAGKYYAESELVSNKLSNYNSCHVRVGDFLKCRPEIKEIKDAELLHKAISRLFSKDVPLYISTDCENLELFDIVRKDYDIYFFSDFNYDVSPLERAVIEQCICVNSNIFYGTQLSTYTKRINVLRGIRGKQADDDMGINNLSKSTIIMPNSYPWKNKLWHWNSSSEWQWTNEY